MIRNREFLRQHFSDIRAEHFTTPLFRDTAALVLDVFKLHSQVPSFEALDRMVDDEIDRRGTRLPRQIPAEWRHLVDDLRRLEIGDQKIIKEQLINWVRDRAFEEMIMACSAIRDRAMSTGRREYDKGWALVREALAVGVDINANTLDYFEDTERRMRSMLVSGLEYGGRIPTLLPTIDDKIEGGASRQEMVVWAAPTGRGKTHALMWVCKAALYQGLRIAVATTEMSKDRLAQRLDRAISNMTRGEMLRDPRLAQHRIETASHYRGELRIVELMGKASTVEGIHNSLERWKSDGFEADVIVVDYPGEMRASQKYGERRHELAEIYRDLRTLSREWDASLHTAQQSNRNSLDKAIVNIKDLAECFEVAMMSDLIIAMCQTKDEAARNLVRFFIAKNREGEDHYIAPYYFNKATGNFKRAGDVMLAKDGTIAPSETEQKA